MKREFLENNKAESRVLQFDNSAFRYDKMTEERVEKNDLLGALSTAFSSLKKEYSLNAIEDVADIYADMGLFEYSNKFWFKYLASAPKEKRGTAYEELAINFFYMDSVALSFYYFQKAVDEKGHIDGDGIDPEILEYFVNKTDRKKGYKIVYPPERVDYKLVLKEARAALKAGDVEKAKEKYSQVPKTSKEYKEALSESVVAYFLTDEYEQAIEKLKTYQSEFGEDVFSLCNLSSTYHFSGNDDKANYYYKKALERDASTTVDRLKLATVAIEQQDHATAVLYLEKVIDEKFFDTKVLLLYGLALINANKYEKAKSVFNKLIKIDSENPVFKFYSEFSDKLLGNDERAEKLLPVNYDEEIPEKEAKKRAKKITDFTKKTVNEITAAFKKQEIRDIFIWGLRHRDALAEETALILTALPDKEYGEFVAPVLVDPFYSKEVKRILTYFWITKGYFGKITVATEQFFVKFRARKMPSFYEEGGERFFASYVNALLNLVFMGEQETDKVAFGADKVYKRFKDDPEIEKYDKDEISALTVYLSKFGWTESEKVMSLMFGIKEKRFKSLLRLYKGVKDDKDN